MHILHMIGGAEVWVSDQELKLVEERIRDERRVMVTLGNGSKVVAQQVAWVENDPTEKPDETVDFVKDLSEGQVPDTDEAAKLVDNFFAFLKTYEKSEMEPPEFADKVGLTEVMVRRILNKNSKVTDEIITKVREAFSPPEPAKDE